jgi:hypothetical protein
MLPEDYLYIPAHRNVQEQIYLIVLKILCFILVYITIKYFFYIKSNHVYNFEFQILFQIVNI